MHLMKPPALVLELIPYSPNYPAPNEVPASIIANPWLILDGVSLLLMISLNLLVLTALMRRPRAAGPLPITKVST